MKKTIGGDRLGSGKKMQVDMHGFERSTHDLGYVWRSTMSAGTLVPFMSEVALPGDTFDIDLDCDVKTHPTIGPLFGSYKVQLDVFQVPIRLFNGLLHNNAIGIGMKMSDVVLPNIELYATDITDAKDIDNAQINPSCILSYLGIRGVGVPDEATKTDPSANPRYFNAVPFCSYWSIYKQYYANKQEEIGAVIHAEEYIPTITTVQINGVGLSNSNIAIELFDEITVNYTGYKPNLAYVEIELVTGVKVPLLQFAEVVNEVAGDITLSVFKKPGGNAKNWGYVASTDIIQAPPRVVTFPLENIDKMHNKLIFESAKGTAVSINMGSSYDGTMLTPYVWPIGLSQSDLVPLALNSQEGLAIKTYQSDLFNNWLQTEWIDGTTGINQITAIDTSDGKFTIDALNLAKKVYDMMNRIAISGGTYDDWMEAVYDHEGYRKAYNPMYMGGLIKELVFQEVVSNAGATSEGTEQPLGTLAGKGVMAKKHKGGHVTIKVDEPSYIMGIISLTPRIDYSQGNRWDVHLETMDDLHKPGLDEIGFQELITEQMAWWDTKRVGTEWVQKSAGKQPAWLNYMTNVNQVRGNFAVADNEMFMTLNRRYEKDANGIKDLTTYIDPTKFNFIFAETAIDAQNFWCQIAVDITARRKMSAKVMPNL